MTLLMHLAETEIDLGIAQLSIPFLLIGWLTTIVMAVGKGAFGGGLAILGIPFLSLAIDPLSAAIIVAPLVSLMDIFAINAFGGNSWSKIDLRWLLPGLVVGVALGTAMVALVDVAKVTMIVAVITLVFTAHWFLVGARSPVRSRPPSPMLGLIAGAASGFTTFVAHAGGPPLSMYLLSRGLNKTLYAGTSVIVFTVGNTLKLVPYLILGLSNTKALWCALALAPAAPLGVQLGKRLHDRLPQRTLFLWCYVLLAIAGAKLLGSALIALLTEA